ncbi:MAG: glycosyltransferase [Patescibacteria group bacterium]|nr:glycosyltransferase [Patescibacteria group bacterium]
MPLMNSKNNYKIAIITPVFPPYGGGIGRVAKEDALVLSSKHKVVVFAPCKHTILRFRNAAVLLELFWKLCDFDIAHLHYPFFGTAEIVWLMKKLGLLRCKLVITYHMDVVGSGGLGKFFRFHTKYLMTHILKSADKVVVTSSDYARHSNIKSLLERYPEKFKEIPIGVDDEFFSVNKNSVQEKTILFVGGLDKAHYFKGLFYLLKACSKINNQYKLIIIGNGDLRSQYESKARDLGIQDKVVFAGSVPRKDLPKYYNQADVFVLPSIDKSEAFGIVLLEAMASGTPVIASHLYGVRTLVQDGENGFLVKPKDAENLAEKIQTVLSNPDLARQMGECGRRIIEEKYSLKKVGEKLKEFYSTVIPAKAGIQKIILINNLYGEYARGGAEKVVENLEKDLKKKGYEVFVISSSPFFPLNLCWYGDLSKHRMIFRLFWHLFDMFNLHSFFVIRKILKEKKPDIVWTHNLKGLGYLIPLAIRFLGIKHKHTIHDVQLSVPSGLIIYGKEDCLENSIFLRRWYEKICCFLFGSPDIVISPSKWLMDFYVEKGFFPKSEKDIGFHSVRPPCVAKTKEGNPMSPSRVFNILYIGQIEEHKGIIFAINTLKKHLATPLPSGALGNGVAKFRVHIVGDGSKLEEVKELIKEDSRFIIYGRKTGEELEKIWKKIDLTIVPSLCYENCPTVILESFVHNIPVLASNIGGIGEAVPKECLFEVGDENQFLEKINIKISSLSRE